MLSVFGVIFHYFKKYCQKNNWLRLRWLRQKLVGAEMEITHVLFSVWKVHTIGFLLLLLLFSTKYLIINIDLIILSTSIWYLIIIYWYLVLGFHLFHFHHNKRKYKIEELMTWFDTNEHDMVYNMIWLDITQYDVTYYDKTWHNVAWWDMIVFPKVPLCYCDQLYYC